jgi:hypothetical protein
MNHSSDEEYIDEGINALFDDKESLIAKIIDIKELIKARHEYIRIAMPALYSILESLAYSRYSQISSGSRVKKLLYDYSEEKEDLKKIDILFLYQWDMLQHEQGKGDKLKNFSENIHPKIKKVLIKIYVSEKNINLHMSKSLRFIEKKDLHQKIKKIDQSCNMRESELDRFNRCEVIYQFGRCSMIHEGDASARGFITPDYLIRLLRQILTKMKKECLSKHLSPSQLENSY